MPVTMIANETGDGVSPRLHRDLSSHPHQWVDVDLKQALGMVKQLRVYAYDAYLLVCAMQMGTPLLTLDQPLKLAAANLGIEVLEV
ncbi:MAG: type II toxin-antitoxin system VapC family toxin [Anaerolineae bacterium]|nr:type II toxin-antitoxin system VapC family toxin [Anaerolineae bacterium]